MLNHSRKARYADDEAQLKHFTRFAFVFLAFYEVIVASLEFSSTSSEYREHCETVGKVRCEIVVHSVSNNANISFHFYYCFFFLQRSKVYVLFATLSVLGKITFFVV